MSKQTLKQALYLARAGKSRPLRGAAMALRGLPEGGWAETQAAMREIEERIPARDARSYSVEEFVAGAYSVEGNGRDAGRYRSKLGL